MQLKHLPFSFIVLFSLGLSNFNFAQSTDHTAAEIFAKVIEHYDPNGIWNTYQGNMHLYTISQNRIGHEELFIDNGKSYYKSIRYHNDSTFAVIKQAEKIAFQVNGKAEISAAEVPPRLSKGPYWLREMRAKRFSEWHTSHFSLPLQMRSAGVTPDAKVETKALFGTTCWVLSFPDSYQKVYPNWNMEVINMLLYVDPENDYRIHAAVYEGNFGKDNKGLIHLFSGEMEVAGLKIPARKIYFNAIDHSYRFSDVFSTTPSMNFNNTFAQSHSKLKKLSREFVEYDAIHSNLEKARSYFNPDATFQWPGGGGKNLTVDKYINWRKQQLENVKNEVQIDAIRIDGNESVVFAKWQGTILKDTEHPERVGKVAKAPYVLRLSWNDGKISRMEMYWDNGKIERDLESN